MPIEPFIVEPGNPIVRKMAEISSHEGKLKDMEVQADENHKKAQADDQKYFAIKRSSDLARNKISTATDCLNMFLKENIKCPDFYEFNPSLKFLVSQYLILLYTPECY